MNINLYKLATYITERCELNEAKLDDFSGADTL